MNKMYSSVMVVAWLGISVGGYKYPVVRTLVFESEAECFSSDLLLSSRTCTQILTNKYELEKTEKFKKQKQYEKFKLTGGCKETFKIKDFSKKEMWWFCKGYGEVTKERAFEINKENGLE